MSVCGNDDSHNHKNGRPSSAEQIQIERTLRPYFENSISATSTSQKTEYNIKTVTKYFNEWKKQINEPESKDFLQRCKERKDRTIFAYESQICSLIEDKKDVESLILACKKMGDFSQTLGFYKLKIRIEENIAKLTSTIVNLANAQTADEIIIIEEQQNRVQAPNNKEVENIT